MTPDRDSAAWLAGLAPNSERREETVARLRTLLLRVARAELGRRRAGLPERGRDDLDDLCQQAASDAVVAILAKLPQFRGQSRFTTWACKFVIFEFSTRLRRHLWRERRVEADEKVLEGLPSLRPTPLAAIQRAETLAAVTRAIADDLTDRQRLIFRSAVLDDVPIDVLAERLGSTRGAIYKTLYDARAKLRLAVARAGHGEDLP